MCFMCAISTCLLVKYFAKIKITTNLIGSDGWKAKKPRLNQLWAPWKTDPAKNSANNVKQETIKRETTTSVRRRNLKSSVENRRKTATETTIQTIWRSKKKLSPANDDIVTNPAREINKAENNISQSIDANLFKKTFII